MTPAVYAIILLAVGILLVGIEVAIIPGFGVIGVAGVAAMLAGGWLAWQEYGPIWGVLSIGGGAAASTTLFVLFLKSRTSRAMVLEDAQEGQPSGLPAQEVELVGKTGRVVSDLRPAGIAQIDGRRRDVVADDGEYIEAGATIEVVRVDQNSIVVTAHGPDTGY